MTNPPPLDPRVLARYLANECSDAERAELEHILQARPGAAAFVQSLREAGHTLRTTQPRDVDRGWEVVRRHLLLPNVSAQPAMAKAMVAGAGQRNGYTSYSHRRLWYVGATLAIGVIGLVVGWNGRGRERTGASSKSMLAYTTANGQRGTVTLTDGTIVMLSVASRLEVPADYSAGNHTIQLTGEALINAGHHTGTPLTVITGPTVTQVLGTSFLVRRYRTDTTTTVAVRSGKVSVDRAVVSAGRMIEVGTNGVAHAGDIDLAQFEFVNGVLSLRGVTLAQAIPELDRWYDADIRLGDHRLAAAPFEGDVAAGSLADLAELLTVTFDVRVVRSGRVLTLLPR